MVAALVVVVVVAAVGAVLWLLPVVLVVVAVARGVPPVRAMLRLLRVQVRHPLPGRGAEAPRRRLPLRAGRGVNEGRRCHLAGLWAVVQPPASVCLQPQTPALRTTRAEHAMTHTPAL